MFEICERSVRWKNSPGQPLAAGGMTEKIDSFMARAGIAEDVLVQNEVSALPVLDVFSVGLVLELSAVRARNNVLLDVVRSRHVAPLQIGKSGSC